MALQPLGGVNTAKMFVVVIVGLIATIFLVRVFTGGNTTVEPVDTTVIVNPVTIEPLFEPVIPQNADEGLNTSFAEQSTGITGAAFHYEPTGKEVADLVAKLIEVNPKKQTRAQWEELQDQWVAYSEQDFPRAMVMQFAPPVSTWDSYGRRSWFPDAEPVKHSSTLGSGQNTLTWYLPGEIAVDDANGKPVDQFYNPVMAMVQCAGETFETCRLVAYLPQSLLSNTY
jgi:hypothetical protein